MKRRILAMILCFTMVFTMALCPGFGAAGAYAAVSKPSNNVHNVTQNKWYSTLSAATDPSTSGVKNGDVIEVYKSFTETKSVKIRQQNLTIKAADGYNPTISWTGTDSVGVSYATPYSCIVIYTAVTTSTTFGSAKGTGVLTFDASKASDSDNKGARARVMVHCGKGATLNLMDGIVITGGNTGGGDYNSGKVSGGFPAGSGEVTGDTGFGSGIFMRHGTLNMSGGIIRDNYSLWGTSPTHNYVGGGGGVYLYGNTDGTEYTTMTMTGGTITHNAAGSGGGGGILVGYSSKLTVKGGTISENVCRFASGGGIGVRNKAEVKVQGGLIKENVVEGHGGGLFARGDAIPLEITGGTFEGNTAGNWGGGVLFWTVGDDVTKNAVKIGGNAKIIGNKATNGAGISVGREVLDGKPIGSKAKLIVEGTPIIEGNIASENGGGIYMQPDEYSTAVNDVEISGGTFTGNEAANGAGIYVPGGTVNLTGGNFVGNKASDRGAGIYASGGAMDIDGATFNKNAATKLGGGAYVENGTVTLNSGTLSENTAKDGGALYISGGNYVMNDGTVDSNEATQNGGAVFVNKGNVTVKSGYLTNNKATGQGSYGGGIYVNEGDVVVGIMNCDGSGDKHTVTAITKIHPIVENNTAQDSGGGIAIGGKGDITMYCGEIVTNHATNKGRGLNVYMENGNFEYYNGFVGEEEDPGLVIVGGKFINKKDTNVDITLKYFHCNESEDVSNHTGEKETKTATVTKTDYINLPDGEKYWTAENNTRFFGWTFNGPEEVQDVVRKKEDYTAMGESIPAVDTHDKLDNNEIKLYALWAPKVSEITVIAKVNNDGEGAVYNQLEADSDNNLPETYAINESDYTITITDESIHKPGYSITGWYIYQEEGQNANWGYEPAYVDNENKTYSNLDYAKLQHYDVNEYGDLVLPVEKMTFGDIVLIAEYEPQFRDLKIVKSVEGMVDADQLFMFQVTGQPDNPNLPDVDITVTISGKGSNVINHLPIGEYKVKEITDWSWRYEMYEGDKVEKSINIRAPQAAPYEMTFKNERKNPYWLSGDAYQPNLFSGFTQVGGR